MKRVIDRPLQSPCVQVNEGNRSRSVRRLIALTFAGVSLCSLLPQAARAQAAPEASGENTQDSAAMPGDIVVTAQKRAQRLNDVGITITTASGPELQNAGIEGPSGLAKISSGFSSAQTISGFQVFSIRGVNFNASQMSASPTVSSYIDEAALPYTSMTQGLFLDVDRVEILKGPQGTLFGQNATGGSINVISAKPTDYTKAGFNTDVNNFGEVTLGGYLSGPLSKSIKARFAFRTTQFGDWQKRYFEGRRKIGDQNRGAARLIVDAQVTDKYKISLNVNGNYDHGQPQSMQFAFASPAAPANASPALLAYPKPPRNDRAADANIDQKNDSYLYQGILRQELELSDSATLTSITNYIYNQYGATIDVDATALSIGEDRFHSIAKSFGQELRLSGTAIDGRGHYIFGLNYQNDRFDQRDLGLFGQNSSVTNTNLLTRFKEDKKSAAVFGNIDFKIVGGLEFTGGMRYTKTKQTFKGCTGDAGDGSARALLGGLANFLRSTVNLPPTDAYATSECATVNNVPDAPGGTPTFLPVRYVGSQKQDNWGWRAGLNFKPNKDTLIYGLVSRAYKVGGYPFQHTVVVSQIQPVSQEQLTDYEAGIKTELFDRALSIDASAFYYDYRDKQFFTYALVPVIGPAPTLTNIPKSTVKGFDISLVARPFSGLVARGNLTYADTKIGKFVGIDINAKPINFTGNQFNFAPKLSGNADIAYDFPVSSYLTATVGGSMLYNSKTYGDLANSATSKIPEYAVFDARVGLASDKGWRVSVWVRNLTDKYYWTSVGLGSDVIYRFTGRPRTFGVSTSFTFE